MTDQESVRTRWRVKVSGTLVARSPLHIGSGRSDPGLDLPVTTDGHGLPVIPGTSLAGVLRHLLGEADGESVDACAVAAWGSRDAASRTLVDDAPLLSDTSPDVREVLTTTKLDAHRGVASAEALVAREVITAGSRFDLRITVETGEPTSREALERANALAGHLMAGVTLGAAGTRGLGRIQLDANLGLKIEVFGDLGTKRGVLAALDDQGDLQERPEVVARLADRLEVKVDWSPAATLMCGVASIGEADVVPRTTTRIVRKNGRPRQRAHLMVLGSSIKGALRARACLIADAVDAHEAVTVLFGDENGAQRGALEFDDVYTQDSVDASSWEKSVHDRGNQEDAAERRQHYRNGLRETNGLPTELVDRVAIDRWTGGAAEGQLFTALEPRSGIKWQPMKMRFHASRVRSVEQQRSAMALFFLVLRDLGNGRVPLGRGTRRGWGALEVSAIQINKHGSASALMGLEKMTNLLAPTVDEREKLSQLMNDAFTRPSSGSPASLEES